jgi:hypothetical protein
MLHNFEIKRAFAMKACAGIALATVTLALVAQARKSYRSIRQAAETKRALAQASTSDREPAAGDFSIDASTQIDPITGKLSPTANSQDSFVLGARHPA